MNAESFRGANFPPNYALNPSWQTAGPFVLECWSARVFVSSLLRIFISLPRFTVCCKQSQKLSDRRPNPQRTPKPLETFCFH